jgi:hypothetical protein
MGQGIQRIQAFSPSYYCRDVQLAVIRADRYGLPSIFMTTASANNINYCNNMPVVIYFIEFPTGVTVRFGGAYGTYSITAYREDNSIIGSNSITTRPHTYQKYQITVASNTADISRVILKPSSAATLISEIESWQ